MAFLKAFAYVAAALCWHLLIFRLAPKLRLVKPNFAGKQVMASYGIVLFGYFAAICGVLLTFGYVPLSIVKLYLAVMGAMCALGLIDDVFGSREVGGFSGHFKKLLLERKLTTGALKAIGGGVVGIVGGYYASEGIAARWILAAVLIPLSANLLNLIDLRPGRSVAVFFTGLVVTYMGAGFQMSAPWLVAAIAASALLFALTDSCGRAMMGDSGSNALGAALGLAITINTGLAFQIGAIILFVAVHWYSEKHSISQLIERSSLLRAIDHRLGVR
jgi:UDP-N-acetylmuramyl pentapeptide phosphotransferase/UDP-N-acetylglucosamine-1-phosphate transferase